MLHISSGLVWVDFAKKSSVHGRDNLKATLPQKWSALLVQSECFIKLSAMRPYYRKDEMTVAGIPFPVNHALPWTFLRSLGEWEAAVDVYSWRFFIGFLMNWG